MIVILLWAIIGILLCMFLLMLIVLYCIADDIAKIEMNTRRK